MDKTRIDDIEAINRAYQSAPNYTFKKHYEKLIEKIMRESGAVRERREELVGAVRSGDKRAMMRYQEEIRKIRLDETYGRLDH